VGEGSESDWWMILSLSYELVRKSHEPDWGHQLFIPHVFLRLRSFETPIIVLLYSLAHVLKLLGLDLSYTGSYITRTLILARIPFQSQISHRTPLEKHHPTLRLIFVLSSFLILNKLFKHFNSDLTGTAHVTCCSSTGFGLRRLMSTDDDVLG